MKEKYDVNKIVAFLKGEIKGAEKSQFLHELKDDPDLAELKIVISQLLAAGEINKSEEASGARQLAMDIYRDYLRKIKQPEINRGVLVFDSRDLPLPEGVRRAEVDSRWRTYRFEAFEIDLSSHPITPDSFQVTGRVNGLESGNLIKITMTSGKKRYRSEGDPNNIFYFNRLPAGSYILSISSTSGHTGIITVDL